MDELPGMIEAGLALMAAVGGVGVTLNCAPPHPANSMVSKEQGIIQEEILFEERRTGKFVKMSSFLLLVRAS